MPPPANPYDTVCLRSLIAGQRDFDYNINYRGSWGGTGANDRLLWLAMVCCNVLDEYDVNGNLAVDRWGPAFGGLHIMTGYNEEGWWGDGSVEKEFAEDMLGVYAFPIGGSIHLPPRTIVQAWVNSSQANFCGWPAAMGPLGPSGVCDLRDFYWGKGSVGPTITPSWKYGWWYMHTP